MALFNVLKEDVEAKKRDPDFLYKIQQRGIQFRDNDDLSKEALIEAAAIVDGSSSITLPNTHTLATGSQFHRSAAAVTRAESDVNADDKTDAAHGVEGNVPTLQFWGLPLKLIKAKWQCGRGGKGLQARRGGHSCTSFPHSCQDGPSLWR